MKKIFRGAAMLLFGATLTMALASCHKGDSDQEATVTEKLSEKDAPTSLSKTLVVKSNVPAKFVYAGVTKGPATEGAFENTKATGKLVVTPVDNAYLPRTVDVAFGDDDWKQVDVILYKVSKNASYQTPGEELKVTNDQENQDENLLADDESGAPAAVTAELVVPADAGNTGNTADPYSITVFTPSSAENKAVSLNQPIEDAVLGLDCRPDGAVFTNPVKVNLYIPGSDNLNIRIINHDNKNEKITFERIGGNNVSIFLKHFSIYDIMMIAEVVSVENNDEVIYDNTFDVAAGPHQVDYSRKLGYVADYTAKTLIGKFLDNTFGVPMFVQESHYNFNAPAPGKAHVTLKQTVRTFNFRSQREDDPTKYTDFKVVVYGKTTPSVELTHSVSPDTKTHSGGSND